MRWLITNRTVDRKNDTFGTDQDALSYWTYDPGSGADIQKVSSWTSRTSNQFKTELAAVASAFPPVVNTPTNTHKHVCLFIHGYNEGWNGSVGLYDKIARNLFDGADSLGELVSFDWPSKGSLLGYLPDQAEAKKTGDDLTEVLSDLYDWMAKQAAATVKNIDNACRARSSIIAHSMGNFVLEYALQSLWTRKNRPLLVSLLQEVLMVAADVDNDLFSSGENVSKGGGEGLANLSYRITALYSGRDDVLGASTGLKHFGKRRLGRAGLDRTYPLPDNVWDVDCTPLFVPPPVNGIATHGEYFEPVETKIAALMRAVLQGTDRGVLISDGLVPAALPKQQQ